MTHTITVNMPALPQQKRLLALDAARGIAIIGMFIQHFALNNRNASIVSGNTMILFILCSGISFSIMTAKTREKGTDSKSFCSRILARSVFIDLVGYLLLLLNGPFAVILPAYAMLFLLALLFRNRSSKTLFWTSALLFLLSPIIMILGMSFLRNSAILQDLAGGPLSGIALLPVFLSGMFIGRLDLKSSRRAIRFLLLGTVMVAMIKILSISALPALNSVVESWMIHCQSSAPEINEYAAWPLNTQPVMWHMITVAAPQNGSTFTLILGLGVSLIVLGASVLIEKKLPVLLIPFSRLGQVALSMYVLQIVVGWILLLANINTDLGSIPFGDVGIAVIATAIGSLLSLSGTGPIEKLLKHFEKVFS